MVQMQMMMVQNYQCDITSYDYDAPVSESGDVSEKYRKLQEFIGKTFPGSIPNDASSFRQGFTNYGEVELKKYISLKDITSLVKPIKEVKISSMEMLQIHEEYGQSYGYIIYQTKI